MNLQRKQEETSANTLRWTKESGKGWNYTFTYGLKYIMKKKCINQLNMYEWAGRNYGLRKIRIVWMRSWVHCQLHYRNSIFLKNLTIWYSPCPSFPFKVSSQIHACSSRMQSGMIRSLYRTNIMLIFLVTIPLDMRKTYKK